MVSADLLMSRRRAWPQQDGIRGYGNMVKNASDGQMELPEFSVGGSDEGAGAAAAVGSGPFHLGDLT